MEKLSMAQQRIVDALKSDSLAYVVSSEYWDFQILVTGVKQKQTYFKRRTREFLVNNGLIVLKEGTKNHYILPKP